MESCRGYRDCRENWNRLGKGGSTTQILKIMEGYRNYFERKAEAFCEAGSNANVQSEICQVPVGQRENDEEADEVETRGGSTRGGG